MKAITKIGFLFLFMVISSCATKTHHPTLRATQYVQHSSEFQAISHQVYQDAASQLRKQKSKKSAIVFDVDETVLDNSPYQGFLIKNKTSYKKESWNQWVNQKTAVAISGAQKFINKAHALGYKIIYITNRYEETKKSTYENLVNLGFPVDKKWLLLRTDTSDKTKRRQLVEKSYKVKMYFGDSITDFPGGFENKSPSEQRELILRHKRKFSKEWFILPNPLYGHWQGEKELYSF